MERTLTLPTQPQALRNPVPGGLGADDLFSTQHGFVWNDVSTVSVRIEPSLVNAAGLLLGPVGFALVDYAMASVLYANTTEGEAIATLNIAINFVASADSGWVSCTADLDRRNRHIAVLSATTRHEDGRLIATAVGSFSVFDAAKLPSRPPAPSSLNPPRPTDGSRQSEGRE